MENQMAVDFLGLPSKEKKAVLIDRNDDFRNLPQEEQDKVIGSIEKGGMEIANLFAEGKVPEDSPEYTAIQQIYTKIRPYAKPAVEMGTMTGGAIVGSPVAPPFGAIAGGGLGYAMAQNIFKMLDAMIMGEETKGFVGEAVDAASDIAEGAAYETTGQVIAPVIKGAGGLGKRIISNIGERTALTQGGAKKKAAEIFKKESMGTKLTQPQIEKNIQVAKELELKLRQVDPEFRFTQGQLTGDASAISLERTLARKSPGGQDLSQEQRQYAADVLRQYYAKKMSSFKTQGFAGEAVGSTDDLIAHVQNMSKGLEVSTKKAQEAVDSEVLRLMGYMEQQEIGKRVHSNLFSGKTEMKNRAAQLYDKIPDLKLGTSELNKSIKNFVKAEDGIVESRTKEMITLINKKISKKPKKLSRIEQFEGKEDPSKTVEISYQLLRKLHSRVGKNFRAANSGANPDLEDARQLFALQGFLDDAMQQITKTNPVAADAYNKATRFYKEVYIPTFRQGTAADVLQKGVRGEETRIAKANIAQAFDSLDGVDDFIRALGKSESTMGMMKDYYKFKFINAALDFEGKVVAKKAAQWLSGNAGKLKKLGFYDEFKNLPGLQKEVDELVKYKDTFNKSVAGRILEADIDKVIANAFRGSKNYAKTAQELLEMVKGNKAAEAGLKKAFAENLMKQAETTQTSFFQSGGDTIADIEFSKSVAKMINQFKKYLPAIRSMYRNEPEKQQAIMNMWKAYETLGRTARSPVGGGSDTFELFGKSIDIVAGSTVPGKWYAFKAIRDIINRMGTRNVEKYLTRAMFDPDYAQTLISISTKGSTPARISKLTRLITIASYATDSTVADMPGIKGMLHESRKMAAPITQLPPVR